MLDLHDREWKDFRLLDYFRHEKGNQNNMAELRPGAFPLVSARNANNGYKDFVSENEKKHSFEGFCLTINNDGDGGAGISYYQPCKMLLDSHVTALYPKASMTEEILKFFSACITAQREKFGHGYPLNNTRLSVFRVMLPVDESGNPDYAFMEQYIKEREQQIIQNYIDYIGDNVQIGEEGITPLNQKEWKEFFVEDVVTILPGRDIYDAERIPGKTPYVSSSSVNNGICHFVNNANDTLEANCISVNRNGSVGFAFYHPYEALFSNDCRKLRPKYKSNYISLFIATQITAQRNKYSYGYKMGTARLKRQKIMLPTTDNGTPDYDYMEQYVRQQIATLKLQYLQEKVTVAI